MFVTADAGRSWRDSGIRTEGQAVGARVPCHIGTTWAVPVQVDDHLVVLSAPAATGPWTTGPVVPAAGRALVTCTPSRVVAAVPAGGSEQLFAAEPGAAWSSLGSLDRRLDSLAAASDITAFATDDDTSRMLEVALGGDLRVTETPLPDWVATIGGPPMRT